MVNDTRKIQWNCHKKGWIFFLYQNLTMLIEASNIWVILATMMLGSSILSPRLVIPSFAVMYWNKTQRFILNAPKSYKIIKSVIFYSINISKLQNSWLFYIHIPTTTWAEGDCASRIATYSNEKIDTTAEFTIPVSDINFRLDTKRIRFTNAIKGHATLIYTM